MNTAYHDAVRAAEPTAAELMVESIAKRPSIRGQRRPGVIRRLLAAARGRRA